MAVDVLAHCLAMSWAALVWILNAKICVQHMVYCRNVSHISKIKTLISNVLVKFISYDSKPKQLFISPWWPYQEPFALLGMYVFNQDDNKQGRTENQSTLWCRYDSVNFHPNSHKRHLIAFPWGRGMGCLLRVQPLIKFCPGHCSTVYNILL